MAVLSGFFVNQQDMSWVFRWFSYVDYLNYGWQACRLLCNAPCGAPCHYPMHDHVHEMHARPHTRQAMATAGFHGLTFDGPGTEGLQTGEEVLEKTGRGLTK